jgi:hypothetical protein
MRLEDRWPSWFRNWDSDDTLRRNIFRCWICSSWYAYYARVTFLGWRIQRINRQVLKRDR